MALENSDPASAHAAMQADPDHVLIDVRTPMEFAQGRPKGSVNIPWAMPDPSSGMMAPNPNFVADVKKIAAGKKTVFVSCQSGGRSMGACRDLANAGFQNLVNIDGGFGGKRDGFGRVVAPGWRDAGLPVES